MIEDAELLFLIWRSLDCGKLAGVARVLEEEASKHGLLPTRVGISGQVHPVTFSQHGSVRPHVPPDALRRLLEALQQHNKGSDGDGGSQVLSLTAPGKHGLLGHAEDELPAWWRRPHGQASLPHQLLLRQTGAAGGRLGMPRSGSGSAATGLLCRRMRLLNTARGHRLAAYCCTYDSAGRRVITGSDDFLVKIWSAETGVLLKCCRGHDAEISDLAVSCDNRLLASGDMANSIRVWSLQEETLGWPVSVLSGHTNSVALLDFHPVLPDALLSCSTDGTCRIWHARDPGVAAVIMRPSATFGGRGRGGGGGGPVDNVSGMAQDGDEVPGTDAAAPVGPFLYATVGGVPGGVPAGASGSAAQAVVAPGPGLEPLPGLASPEPRHPPAPPRAGSVEPLLSQGGASAANGAGRAGGETVAGRLGPRVPGAARGAAPSTEAAAPPGQDREAAPEVGPAEEAAGGLNQANPGQVHFICCSWSPDGSFIFAGGTDCTVCVWHWDLTPPPPQQQQQPPKPQSQSQLQLELQSNSQPQAQAQLLLPTAQPSVQLPPPPPQHLQQPSQPPQSAEPAFSGLEHQAGGASAGGGGVGTATSSVAAISTAGPVPVDGVAGSDVCTNTSAGVRGTGAAAEPAGAVGDSNAGVPSGAAAASATEPSGSGLGVDVSTGTAFRAGTAVGHTGGGGGATVTTSREALAAVWEAREWPQPVELTRLCGHRNDIVFIEFSHEGSSVATASRDGCVKIWRRERERRRGRLHGLGFSWREAMSLACPATEEEIRKARLKRKPPPHPAINQVAWNLDDSRMVAAVSDNTVRVWDTYTGAAEHILLEHTAQAHVLEAHPHDPRLVMSGGYDGRTILWDVIAGRALRIFSTQDTFPGRGRWTDPLQLLDGHFSPDGAQLAVTDAAGQLHLYGVPVAASIEAMARAPYDQFLGSDYNPLVRDVNGWVLDEYTQRPPHLVTSQPLCDYTMHPHGVEVQAAYTARRLADLPRPHPVDRNHPLPAALVSHPPTMVAALMRPEDGSLLMSNTARQQAMSRAYERHMRALEALQRPDEPRGGRGSRRSSALPPSNANPLQRPLSGAAAASAAAAAAVPRGVYLLVEDPTAAASAPPLYGRAGAADYYDDDDSSDGGRGGLSDGGGDGDGDDGRDPDVDFDVISISSDEGGSDSSDGEDLEDEEEEELEAAAAAAAARAGGSREGDRRRRGQGADSGGGDDGGGRSRGRLRRRDGSAAGRGGGGGSGTDGDGGGPSRRRSNRRERSATAGSEDQDPEQDAEEQRAERTRRSARLTGHKRRYGDGDLGPESNGSDGDEDYDLADLEDVESEEEEEEPEADEDSDQDANARRRQQRAAARRQQQLAAQRERRAALRQQRERKNQQRREQRREERRRREQQRELQLQQQQQQAGGPQTSLYEHYQHHHPGAPQQRLRQGDGGGGGGGGTFARTGHGQQRQRAEEDDELIGPRSSARPRVQLARFVGLQSFPEPEEDEAADADAGVAVVEQVARRRSHEAGGSRPRPLDAYAWLQCTAYLPDYYCPQLGEDVVYVRAGHEAYLESVGDKRAARPWLQLPGMRPSEPCMITGLSYEILRDGVYRTAVNLQLAVDPNCGSPVAGQSFSLQLPPPCPDQREFLVPLELFKWSNSKRWRIGEECKTFQVVDGSGQWHHTRIVEDRLNPQLAEGAPAPPPPAQIHACEEVWERFGVAWGDEVIYLSPWDLLPPTAAWDDVVRRMIAAAGAKQDELDIANLNAASASAVGPSAGAGPSSVGAGAGGPGRPALSGLELGGGWAEEQATAARLALERLFAEGEGAYYSLFFQCPPPSALYPCADGEGRPVPYNAIVPLPLGLEVVEQRMQNTFYRSLAAVRNDIDTIVSNAERFNGADSPVAQRARLMRLHFTACLVGGCVDDLILLGPDVIVRRRRRPHGSAAERRRRPRTDLSRLWEHVALLDEEPKREEDDGAPEDTGGADEAAEAAEAAARRQRSGVAGPGAIRGGAELAGGFSGPRRRGGPMPPPASEGVGPSGTRQSAAAGTSGAEADGGVEVPVALAGLGAAFPEPPMPPSGPWQLQQHLHQHQPQHGTGREGPERGGPTSPALGSRQRQRQPLPPQASTRLEPTEGRPRRDRNRTRVIVAAMYGSDSEEDGDAEDDSEDDSAAAVAEFGSDSDSDGRGQHRRRRQQQKGSQRSRRHPPRHQAQPLRRSNRARQRTKYGSDWEDEHADEESDELRGDSDDDGGGGLGRARAGSGGAVRRASGRHIAAKAAVATDSDAGDGGGGADAAGRLLRGASRGHDTLPGGTTAALVPGPASWPNPVLAAQPRLGAFPGLPVSALPPLMGPPGADAAGLGGPGSLAGPMNAGGLSNAPSFGYSAGPLPGQDAQGSAAAGPGPGSEVSIPVEQAHRTAGRLRIRLRGPVDAPNVQQRQALQPPQPVVQPPPLPQLQHQPLLPPLGTIPHLPLQPGLQPQPLPGPQPYHQPEPYQGLPPFGAASHAAQQAVPADDSRDIHGMQQPREAATALSAPAPVPAPLLPPQLAPYNPLQDLPPTGRARANGVGPRSEVSPARGASTRRSAGPRHAATASAATASAVASPTGSRSRRAAAVAGVAALTAAAAKAAKASDSDDDGDEDYRADSDGGGGDDDEDEEEPRGRSGYRDNDDDDDDDEEYGRRRRPARAAPQRQARQRASRGVAAGQGAAAAAAHARGRPQQSRSRGAAAAAGGPWVGPNGQLAQGPGVGGFETATLLQQQQQRQAQWGMAAAPPGMFPGPQLQMPFLGGVPGFGAGSDPGGGMPLGQVPPGMPHEAGMYGNSVLPYMFPGGGSAVAADAGGFGGYAYLGEGGVMGAGAPMRLEMQGAQGLGMDAGHLGVYQGFGGSGPAGPNDGSGLWN